MTNLLSKRWTKIVSILCIFSMLYLSLADIALALTSTKPNIIGPGGTHVNSYTGSLFHQRTDLFIPGRGLSLEIKFSYNSGRTAKDWGYGDGWSFTYSMQYYFDILDVIIERSDGRKDRFAWNGSSYDPPTGVFDNLAEYQSGEFRLTTKHGVKYFFDESSHKKLTKIEDTNGNTIIITYASGNPTTISDLSERNLTLAWTGGRLTQITDANASPTRTVSYQYDGSGNPVQVTDPMGNTTSYAYGYWSNISTVTNARGNTTNIAYNGNKAVSGISTATTNKTIIYDTENKKTIVTDQVGTGNQITGYTPSLTLQKTIFFKNNNL